MTRRALAWIALVVLATLLAAPLTGCNRSAVGDDVAKLEQQMAQEAEQNTATQPPATQPPATEPGAPTETTEPATEPTSPPATEAPPVATEQPPADAPTTAPQPPAEAPAAAPAPVVTAPGTHVVQAGENLFRIALRYGVSVDALARANSITNAATIYVGQVLTIPGGTTTPGTPPSEPVTTPSSGAATVHVVQPGENLFRIALRYGLDYHELARYNGISNPAMVYVGQQIKIPAR